MSTRQIWYLHAACRHDRSRDLWLTSQVCSAKHHHTTTVTGPRFEAFMIVCNSSANYHARCCRSDDKICEGMYRQGYSMNVVERDLCRAIKPSVPPWDCNDNLNRRKQYQELLKKSYNQNTTANVSVMKYIEPVLQGSDIVSMCRISRLNVSPKQAHDFHNESAYASYLASRHS